MKRVVTLRSYERICNLYKLGALFVIALLKFACVATCCFVCMDRAWNHTWCLLLAGACLLFPVFESVAKAIWQMADEDIVIDQTKSRSEKAA